MAYPQEPQYVEYLEYREQVDLGEIPGPALTWDQWKANRLAQSAKPKPDMGRQTQERQRKWY